MAPTAAWLEFHDLRERNRYYTTEVAKAIQDKSDTYLHPRLRGKRRYASKNATYPTLVYLPSRDGPCDCFGQVWIASIDPVTGTNWLKEIKAVWHHELEANPN